MGGFSRCGTRKRLPDRRSSLLNYSNIVAAAELRRGEQIRVKKALAATEHANLLRVDFKDVLLGKK
jgi:hypothetical protein